MEIFFVILNYAEFAVPATYFTITLILLQGSRVAAVNGLPLPILNCDYLWKITARGPTAPKRISAKSKKENAAIDLEIIKLIKRPIWRWR